MLSRVFPPHPVRSLLELLPLLFVAATTAVGTGSTRRDNAAQSPSSSFGVPGQNLTFDYVVIGGGTAGLVMATRLAMQVGTSVAVIEAGNFYELSDGNLSVIPADAVFYAGSSPNDTNPAVDWGFVTTAQSGMNGRKLHYARGKCLGGSSARNYFTYQLGTKDSYAMWAEDVDDASYTYENFLPYFKRSISITAPNNTLRAPNASVPYNPDFYTPSGGPLKVSIPIFANSFSSFVKLAFKQLGIQSRIDFLSGALFGVQYNMNTIDPKGNTRSSSQTSYLEMAMESEDASLKVYNYTLAKKIIFEGKRASGVSVNTSGLTYILSARKEVILSAGAFQSPQMLMVSGIGPPTTLQQLNITLVAALPGVGQNMWDHVVFGQSYQVNVPTHSALSNLTTLAIESVPYFFNGSGMLGNPGGDLLAWEKLPFPARNALSDATQDALRVFPPDWPEIEYLVLDAYSGNNENYIANAPETPFMYASPVAALVAPLSRGNVTIASSDTTDAPIINPNWLTHEADRELMVAAFKRLRVLMDTAVMAEVTVSGNGSASGEVYPGREAVNTDQEILEVIQEGGTMVFHASATCKMGKSTDVMAVVDSHARVFGVEALRVVDASAFPFLPPGHPQSTVYALAEKIAEDIIKGDGHYRRIREV